MSAEDPPVDAIAGAPLTGAGEMFGDTRITGGLDGSTSMWRRHEPDSLR
jgi:hypothetical protein